MTDKKDPVHKALEDVAEAATLLALHGAGGYSLESSALDVVFLRALRNLNAALGETDKLDFYDPTGDLSYALQGGVE